MIEIVRPYHGKPPRLALLDFDGTLSLIRSGWQEVMTALMVEALQEVAGHETPEDLAHLARTMIDTLTGQATIIQMAWLVDEIARRGGNPESAECYKEQFLARLRTQIERRLAAIRSGHAHADAFLVPGSRALLEALRQRGIIMALASGTDHADVLIEAAALGIDHYFGQQIYGPAPDDPGFSKHRVVTHLLERYNLCGAELVAIGDGPVEIEAVRDAGGVTIGVALDEQRGAGIDSAKLALQIRAGVDAIVPDFREPDILLEYIFSAD